MPAGASWTVAHAPDGLTCGGAGPNQCGAGACSAKSCAQLEASCGLMSDGCGSVLDCGTCTLPETCGGAGKSNQCGCKSTTCAEQDAECGTISDECGGTLDCGSCEYGSCESNHCSCTPTTCSAQGAECGPSRTNAAALWTAALVRMIGLASLARINARSQSVTTSAAANPMESVALACPEAAAAVVWPPASPWPEERAFGPAMGHRTSSTKTMATSCSIRPLLPVRSGIRTQRAPNP